MELNTKILSDITVYSKYAKYLPDEKRREMWDETVDRNMFMHMNKFPKIKSEIYEVYEDYVRTRKVLPSMRSLQFAGKAIEYNPSRIFNCAYLPIDDFRAFPEVMFLLLGGTGVGYSVQKHHVERLPEIRKPQRSRRFLINDSIEGWADSIKVLMKSYFGLSSKPRFDYVEIRPKGTPLKTAGGKAPGPDPLRECHFKIQQLLDRKEDGSKLTPLEVHDIICHIAGAVLAGGIRRSALISLFSFDDAEMRACKTGDWESLNPQRRTANNSAVALRHRLSREDFFSLFEQTIASGQGEPGVYLTNNAEWGANPSLRKGTKVLTTDGIFPIEELESKQFKVKNLDGEISDAKCWLSGKNRPLYEIKLNTGRKYYCTAEHEWPVITTEGYRKTRTSDLISEDRLPILRENFLFDGDLGTSEDGFFTGWHLGDGWTTIRTDTGEEQNGLIVSEIDVKYGIKDKLEKFLHEEFESDAVFYNRGTTWEINSVSRKWKSWKEKIGYSTKAGGLPKTTWTGSEEFRKGLIDGLFSSDGSVESKKKRIRFHSSHKALIDDVAELLGFYGIKTTVHTKVTELNNKSFVGFVLNITEGASIRHFRNLFSLSHGEKNARINSYTFNDVQENNSVTIESIILTDLVEDVWDISVYDKTHCFQLSHCITGNCVEIGLRPNQFCNLTTINVSDLEDQEDFNRRAYAAGFVGTLQASYTDFHYLREVWQRQTEKDALIGVSMTGIASNRVFDLDIQEAVREVERANSEASAMIGINPAARTTCVKPEGTASLVLGTSSGIHPWHSKYYIRRIRMLKNEAIYQYLAKHHPELVEDEFFDPTKTAVVSIPMKAPEGATTQEESALQFLQRVKKVYTEWVKPGHTHGDNTHNVSATVHIDQDRIYSKETMMAIANGEYADYASSESGEYTEWDIVGAWMWKNRDVYNGLTVLPSKGGNYKQLPFEECDEEEFNRLSATLKKVDLSKVIEEEDNTELKQELACVSGACEIT